MAKSKFLALMEASFAASGFSLIMAVFFSVTSFLDFGFGLESTFLLGIAIAGILLTYYVNIYTVFKYTVIASTLFLKINIS